jgi:5'-nucleotidase (lipoprotein e(P4) family)
MRFESRQSLNINYIKMNRLLALVIIVPFIYSCNKMEKSNFQEENQDPLILPVLWFQKSGEMKALYYQGYNIAKISLTEKLVKQKNTRPNAIVMDIDETVLDNSPVEAYQVIKNLPFSDSLWKRWVKKGIAEPCPGALEFTKFADSLKVDVFYVSNRDMPEEFTPTLRNLRLLGFPFADSVHLILKTDDSSKETRRKTLAEKYNILLLIGDNLADFNVIFDKRGNDFGFNAVKSNANKFGTDYIVLPNPMYGPWINTATSVQQGATLKEKILKALKSF